MHIFIFKRMYITKFIDRKKGICNKLGCNIFQIAIIFYLVKASIFVYFIFKITR